MKKQRNGRYKVSDRVIWYKDGVPHREDGPAVESSYSKEWYLNGKTHREDGPAVEFSGGSKRWFLYGEELTEEEFGIWLSKKNLNEKLNESLCSKQKDEPKKI